MGRTERLREPMSSLPNSEYVRQKAADGWRLVAVEWERAVDQDSEDAGSLKQEIPYGLRVARDCRHLEEAPEEKEALVQMLELIVEDKPLSQVADGLNSRGLHTRDGRPWSQTAIFYMLPRLIEVAPAIFSSAEWKSRRGEVTARLESLIQ